MDGSEIIFALRPKYGRVAISTGQYHIVLICPPFTFAGKAFV